MSVRQLSEADLDRLFALRQLSFLDDSNFRDPGVRARHVARLQLTFGHFIEERLTSAAVCFPFEMFLASRRVAVGGLASVLSAPETRRRGYVRELLHALLNDLKEKGTGWMLEYPFDPRFYARYGFASMPTGAELTIPAESLFRGPSPDAERLGGDPASILEPIYNAWAQTYSLALCRDNKARPTWNRILGNRICYLLEDAYVVFELAERAERQTLTVHDYAFSSPAGRDNLFRFVGSFYGQVQDISLHLPSDEPLALELRYRTNDVPLQARIADVTAALTPLTSEHESTATLHVRDEFCAWNNGTFRLGFSPNGTTVSRSDADPDAALDIATLTQLVTGALSPTAVLKTGQAKGDLGVLELLAALSGGRVPFIPGSDYF